MSLQDEIEYHISGGSYHIPSLGICQMPEGYALMLNPDQSHYYFVRHDGLESVIHWNRWAIYRWAKADAKDPE